MAHRHLLELELPGDRRREFVVMPKPTAHIIDWFHIAMKIQPMQQIADHMARSQRDEPEASQCLGGREAPAA